jgi:glutamyl/glutaminyl-tRNA synthetase
MNGQVLLRIEDHDRERSRPEYAAAILEDLAWLGFVADAGPVRQRPSSAPYEAAMSRLREAGLVYACDCTRSTYTRWTTERGEPWHGPGCPGDCRSRDLPDDGVTTMRAELGDGTENWDDLVLGPRHGEPSGTGDLPIRDRQGNWTYAFSVVVDDLRQSITHVVRGEDLVAATPAQIRLGQLLERPEPPTFGHHPLIRKRGGAKLSKADGDTGVRDLRAVGQDPAVVIGTAAAAIGLVSEPRPVAPSEAAGLVREQLIRAR